MIQFQNLKVVGSFLLSVFLNIPDYMVTSNHTHLLVYDDGQPDVIPKSVQLLAGRVGQEYTLRKKALSGRPDAIETGEDLRQCIFT
jgi:putative transposase